MFTIGFFKGQTDLYNFYQICTLVFRKSGHQVSPCENAIILVGILEVCRYQEFSYDCTQNLEDHAIIQLGSFAEVHVLTAPCQKFVPYSVLLQPLSEELGSSQLSVATKVLREVLVHKNLNFTFEAFVRAGKRWREVCLQMSLE